MHGERKLGLFQNLLPLLKIYSLCHVYYQNVSFPWIPALVHNNHDQSEIDYKGTQKNLSNKT